MRAGKLDRRIAIQRATVAENALGEARPTAWATIATVWANVAPAPGSERYASAERAAEGPTVFNIRWSSDVDDVNGKDRIEYPVDSGALYDIASAHKIGRRNEIEIVATSRRD